ncbi:hypothetical protein FA95DRAFT_1606125 [Auriscalpium vulgare]|uniref:Uncharacterized protein n=1 Tax=Auriscalpium vulgare TaxID=40419 RepID=A0ACB8RUY0_9AGAM|nr:hypothetical protein FA95DRAFT_1606125 [Auriscalpium vulgare]
MHDVGESQIARFYPTDRCPIRLATLLQDYQLIHCITVSYKQVDDLSLLIDIYLHDAEHLPSEPVPAIVYFYGGGLTVGDRTSWFPTWLATRALASGIALVSADYSLLPPATGHTILANVVDLFAFFAAHGAAHHRRRTARRRGDERGQAMRVA